MTAKELYDFIKEAIDNDDMGWDTQVTFESDYGIYFNVNSANVECNGYEFRLYE